MKSIVVLFLATVSTLTTARPTFDVIAKALLDVVDEVSYPSGSARYHQDYQHQHHPHDHYYNGEGSHTGGYYQRPNGGYNPAYQPNYYSPQPAYVQDPPYPQGHYHQRPYQERPYAQENYGGSYTHPAPPYAVGITAEFQPAGYAHQRGYKTHGY